MTTRKILDRGDIETTIIAMTSRMGVLDVIVINTGIAVVLAVEADQRRKTYENTKAGA